MPWLVLNAGEEDELEIRIAEARKRVVQIGGGYFRAFDGTLRATVSTEKFEWEMTTAPLSEADAGAVEAMFANGAEFEMSGDVVGAATYDCMGTAEVSEYVHDGAGHKRALNLVIQQV